MVQVPSSFPSAQPSSVWYEFSLEFAVQQLVSSFLHYILVLSFKYKKTGKNFKSICFGLKGILSDSSQLVVKPLACLLLSADLLCARVLYQEGSKLCNF